MVGSCQGTDTYQLPAFQANYFTLNLTAGPLQCIPLGFFLFQFIHAHLVPLQLRLEDIEISERLRQFCFFTKRSTLLLEKSRKINFLYLFFIEQHAKLFP